MFQFLIFIILCWFLTYNNTNQTYLYIYSLLLSLLSLCPPYPSRSSQSTRLISLNYTATSHQLYILHLMLLSPFIPLSPKEWIWVSSSKMDGEFSCLENSMDRGPWQTTVHQIRSDQISRSVMSDSLRPHELQHARPQCPSPTPGVHSDSRPLSQWCHPAISSSVIPSPPAPNPSQHQSLFQWVNSLHEVAKVLEFQL